MVLFHYSWQSLPRLNWWRESSGACTGDGAASHSGCVHRGLVAPGHYSLGCAFQVGSRVSESRKHRALKRDEKANPTHGGLKRAPARAGESARAEIAQRTAGVAHPTASLTTTGGACCVRPQDLRFGCPFRVELSGAAKPQRHIRRKSSRGNARLVAISERPCDRDLSRSRCSTSRRCRCPARDCS